MQTVCFDGHVQGASHEASNKVCQDYSGSRPIEGANGTAYVAVVADGHGDSACVRSDRGSRQAVEVSLEVLGDFAQEYVDADEQVREDLKSALLDSDEKHDATRELVAQIVKTWSTRILEDYELDPLKDVSWADDIDDEQRTKAIRRFYGTTLVAALFLPDVCIVAQQGDGCATIIYCGGHETLAQGDVVPEDELCVGNITTSLSDSDAIDRMRIVVVDTCKDPLAAVFVGTDGVDKSLPREEGASNLFSGVALDVVDLMEKDSWNEGRFLEDLTSAMKRLSASGSGDDVSIAGIVDPDATIEVARQLRIERDCFDLRTSLANDKARLSSMTRKRDYYLTMIPANEAQAHEREEYLKSYDRLANKIEATERDLGVVRERRSAELAAAEEVLAAEESVVPVDESEVVLQDTPRLHDEEPEGDREEFAKTIRLKSADAQSQSESFDADTQGTRKTPLWLVAAVVILLVIFTALLAVALLNPTGPNPDSPSLDSPSRTSSESVLTTTSTSEVSSPTVPTEVPRDAEGDGQDYGGLNQHSPSLVPGERGAEPPGPAITKDSLSSGSTSEDVETLESAQGPGSETAAN